MNRVLWANTVTICRAVRFLSPCTFVHYLQNLHKESEEGAYGYDLTSIWMQYKQVYKKVCSIECNQITGIEVTVADPCV